MKREQQSNFRDKPLRSRATAHGNDGEEGCKAEWGPASGTLDSWEGAPLGHLGSVKTNAEFPLEGTANRMHRIQPPDGIVRMRR